MWLKVEVGSEAKGEEPLQDHNAFCASGWFSDREDVKAQGLTVKVTCFSFHDGISYCGLETGVHFGPSFFWIFHRKIGKTLLIRKTDGCTHSPSS